MSALDIKICYQAIIMNKIWYWDGVDFYKFNGIHEIRDKLNRDRYSRDNASLLKKTGGQLASHLRKKKTRSISKTVQN